MSFSFVDFLTSGAIMSLSPETLLLAWGEPRRGSAGKINLSLPAFYLSDFFLRDSQPWVQYPQWVEISTAAFSDRLVSEPSPLCDWTIPEFEKFRIIYEGLWQLLQIEQLHKGVPYLFAHSSQRMDHRRLQSCLKNGLAALKQQAGYVYGYWDNSKGVLGLTPELLFSHVEDQPFKVQTMALAGTCHSSDLPESFLKNEKERHEHHIVVESISQSLSSLGSVCVGKTELLTLKRLRHFITRIDVELSQSFDFDLLVHLLHPTPALGAFPIEKGKDWLEKMEKEIPRNYYGAPLGFRHIHRGLSQCLVGIRNVQWDFSGMRIGAGCGVVKESVFEKEWKEIELKMDAIREQFHL